MLLNIGTYINTKNTARDIQKPSLTVASGRAFPIWNTIAGNDRMRSFRIFGETVLGGVPSPDSPAALQSVGDTGLSLLSCNVQSGAALQRIDFKDIILRNLPDGTRDEIVYSDGKWVWIQRVGVIDWRNLQITDAKAPFFFQMEGGYPESQPYIRFTVSNFQTDSIESECNVFPNNANSEVLNSYKISAFNHLLYISLPRSYDSQVKGYEYLRELLFMATYKLADPVERVLDLPALSTYEDASWFASSNGAVRPYMSAECLVYKSMEYIKDGLVALWDFKHGNNNDIATRGVIRDLSGNGYNLKNENFAYTRDSGYNLGYTQYDGIDDFSRVTGLSVNVATIQITLSNMRVGSSGNPWNMLSGLLGNQNYFFGLKQGVRGCTGSTNDMVVYMNGNPNYTIGEGISTFIAIRNKNVAISNSISVSSTTFDSTRYVISQRVYEALAYDRPLSDSDIFFNTMASFQRNGINLLDIDIN